MKNKITGLMLLTMMISTSIFATNVQDNVNRKVWNAFTKNFTDATGVNWSKTEHYVKASFTQNDQVLFAFFAPTGQLLRVSRNLLSSNLPINLLTGLKKDYSEGWITNLVEFANGEETDYYATIESADEVVFLKSIGLNTWAVSKRIEKTEE